MQLSEEDIKVILRIIKQLSFKLPDAKLVQEIVDKLSANIKPVEVIPPDPATYDPANPDKVEPIVQGEVVTP